MSLRGGRARDLGLAWPWQGPAESKFLSLMSLSGESNRDSASLSESNESSARV